MLEILFRRIHTGSMATKSFKTNRLSFDWRKLSWDFCQIHDIGYLIDLEDRIINSESRFSNIEISKCYLIGFVDLLFQTGERHLVADMRLLSLSLPAVFKTNSLQETPVTIKHQLIKQNIINNMFPIEKNFTMTRIILKRYRCRNNE